MAANAFELALAFAAKDFLDGRVVCSLAAEATEVRDSDAKTTSTTQGDHARMTYPFENEKTVRPTEARNRPGPTAVYLAAIKSAIP
jgi:hypothetical protein